MSRTGTAFIVRSCNNQSAPILSLPHLPSNTSSNSLGTRPTWLNFNTSPLSLTLTALPAPHTTSSPLATIASAQLSPSNIHSPPPPPSRTPKPLPPPLRQPSPPPTPRIMPSASPSAASQSQPLWRQAPSLAPSPSRPHTSSFSSWSRPCWGPNPPHNNPSDKPGPTPSHDHPSANSSATATSTTATSTTTKANSSTPKTAQSTPGMSSPNLVSSKSALTTSHEPQPGASSGTHGPTSASIPSTPSRPSEATSGPPLAFQPTSSNQSQQQQHATSSTRPHQHQQQQQGSPSSSPPQPQSSATASPNESSSLTVPSSTLLAAAVRGRTAVQDALGRAGSTLMVHAAAASARLNELTGYSGIEQLKAKVDQADERLAAARERLRSSKAAYEARLAEQSEVQRQLMALLQRKGQWGGADVERFAELCREEHSAEGALAGAKAAYGAASEGLEAAHGSLLRAIRERYAAETLWSDKIRRASTWWTAGLMGLNLVSLLSVYLIMEPIKARRLQNHVEDVLFRELGGVRQSIGTLQAALESHVAAGTAADATAVDAAAGNTMVGSPTARAVLGNDNAASDGTGGAGGGGDVATGVTTGVRSSGVATGTTRRQPAGKAGGGAGENSAELVPEVRQVQQQLVAVERRLAEIGSGMAAQVAAMHGLVERGGEERNHGSRWEGGRGAAGGGGVDGQQRGMKTGGGRGVGNAAGIQEGEAVGALGVDDEQLQAGWEVEEEGCGVSPMGQLKRGAVRGWRWAQRQVVWVAGVPEVRTCAAAFGGAVLGAGVLLVLRDGR